MLLYVLAKLAFNPVRVLGTIEHPMTLFYVLKCPKCYTCRAAEDKYKSWKCFKCGYSMTKKNTKIQAETISIKETQYIIDLLDNKKNY